MINVVNRYFSLNRTLLLIIGLWPYEKSKFDGLKIICIFSILTTCVIFQLTTIVTSKYSAEIVIKVLSTALTFSAFVIKYNSFYVNSKTVKYLMEQVQHIYNDLRDNNEITIINKYGDNAKQYTNGLTMFCVCSAFILVGAQLWPEFIYVVLSKNMSRSRNLQISTEYFIDQEKYFYLSLFHVTASMVIGLIVLITTGSMLIAYLQHACGMFKIASYRIEKAIEMYILKNIYKNDILVYKGIIDAVDIHRKATTFCTYLISNFEISFMFLIVVGVLSLSLNIFQIVLFGNIMEEIPIYLILALCCFLYMFLSNLVGQQIIDHNSDVFITAYKVRWYFTSVPVQKLMLFLLQRGNKKFGLNVAGLFVASLECFSTLKSKPTLLQLINAAVSYFTIMYSMR